MIGMIQNVKTILFSPHSDDIAYSLGGTILSDYFKDPLIITVFTKSTFSPRIKLNSQAEISLIRRKEDESFAKKVGALLDVLHYSEPPLRGLTTNKEIFNSKASSDSIFDQIYESIYDIIRSYPDAVIVSPLGLGNHIDHQIVLQCCIKACDKLGNKIMFYEDIPYVSKLTFRQIKEDVKKINSNLTPIKLDITYNFDQKIENLHLYATQIGVKIPAGVHSHSKRIGYDHIFLFDGLWRYSLIQYICSYLFRINFGLMYERLWK